MFLHVGLGKSSYKWYTATSSIHRKQGLHISHGECVCNHSDCTVECPKCDYAIVQSNQLENLW